MASTLETLKKARQGSGTSLASANIKTNTATGGSTLSRLRTARLAQSKPTLTTEAQIYASDEEKKRQEEEKNKGGVLGGIGYVGEKFGLGVAQGIEGIFDFAIGGIADIVGADDFAERQFANDWFNYSHADEWYNPGEGWKVAGDVAGGVGSSIPTLATAAAVTYFTGGAGAGIAASLVAGTSAAGTSVKEAYQETGELTGKEWGYGVLSGVTEAAIEKISGGLGAGATAIGKRLGQAFGKTAAKEVGKTTLKTVAVDLGKNFLSEAFEEGFSEWVSPYYKRMTYDPAAEKATAGEIAYAAIVGGLSGLVTSGAGATVTTMKDIRSGSKIENSGRFNNIKAVSEVILEAEGGKTNSRSVNAVRDLYRDLTEGSLKITDGDKLNVRQKRALGELENANMSALFEDKMQSAAINAVKNADSVAERLNSYGNIKLADGKLTTISDVEAFKRDNPGVEVRDITAEDIRAGFDTKDGKDALYKAMKGNDVLRYVAASDVAGRLIMSVEQFENTSLEGTTIKNQVDLNQYIEKTTPEKRAALGAELGIADNEWNTLQLGRLNEAIKSYRESGKAAARKGRIDAVNKAKSIDESQAKKKIPSRVVLGDGKVERYKTDKVDIAVYREGDSFTVYDYNENAPSRALTRAEVNNVLEQIKSADSAADVAKTLKTAENAELTNMNQENVKVSGDGESIPASARRLKGEASSEKSSKQKIAEVKEKIDAKKIDAELRESVSDYDGLKEADKSMIRKVVREGRVHGLDEADVMSYARVAARTGLNIEYDANMKDGEAGLFDPENNRIVVNPNTTKKQELILIHELDHAIRAFIGNDGKVHYLVYEDADKKLSQETRDMIKEQYPNQDVEVSIDELLADESSAYYSEAILGGKNTVDLLLGKEPSLAKKILNFFTDAARAYFGDEKLSKEARAHYRRFKKLFDSFAEFNKGRNAETAVERTGTNEKSARQSKNLEANLAEYKKPITHNDILTLRAIGRKSINEFTSADIDAAGKWAYKFYKEMGVKSPFFRAWFGDWRAYDTKTKIPVVPVNAEAISRSEVPRGDFNNEDTGWSITSNADGIDETSNKEKKQSDSYHALKDVNALIKNAVLLDTVVATEPSKRLGKDAAFVHHLYCPVSINGKVGLAKLYIAESLGNKHKFYLMRIEKASTAMGFNTENDVSTPRSKAASVDATISISQIYEFVKAHDKDFEKNSNQWIPFSPKPVNELLLDENKQPKVFYHGTNAEFWEFKAEEMSHREGSYFFAENKEDAEAYGDNVYEVYLRGENLADYDNQPSEFYKLKSKREQVEWLKERGYDGWYADMDSGGWGELSVFSSEQIKSATDNIGTFDKENPDIRRSTSHEATLDSDYLDAVNRGDMETAQKMVDEAAKAAMPDSKIIKTDGSLRKVYHGTNTGDFTVFNPDYIGMSSGDGGFFGKGFYFAYSKGEAKYYGAKRVVSAYLNIRNPFNFQTEMQTFNGKRAVTGRAPDAVAFLNFAEKFPKIAEKTFVTVFDGDRGVDISLVEFAKAFRDVLENKTFEYQTVKNEFGEQETLALADKTEYTYEYDGETRTYFDYDFERRFYGEANEIDVAYEYLSTVVYKHFDMYSRTRLILENNDEFTQALKEMGYDGAIQSQEGDEAVAFYPEQIKSADPVTYDDDGNVIPLSERFNPKNSDIRYSTAHEAKLAEGGVEESIGKLEEGKIESVMGRDARAGARRASVLSNRRANMTVGQMRQMIARYTGEKVYTSKEARETIDNIYGIYSLSQKNRAKLYEALWQGYNACKTDNERQEFSYDMAEYVTVMLLSESSVENPDKPGIMETLSKLKSGIGRLTFNDSQRADLRHVLDKSGYKKFIGRWGFRETMQPNRRRVAVDVFIHNLGEENPEYAYLKEMTPQDAILELDRIYERTLEASKQTIGVLDDMPDHALGGMIDDIGVAIYESFSAKGEKSTVEKVIEARIASAERKYANLKQKYDELERKYYDEQDRPRKLLNISYQIEKMKALKLGTFLNATDYKNDVFKQTFEILGTIEFRGTLSPKKVRLAMKRLAEWYTAENPVLKEIDGAPGSGYYSDFTALMINNIAEGDGALSMHELTMLDNILRHATHIVENFNRVWKNGKWVKADDTAKGFVGVADSARLLRSSADMRKISRLFDNVGRKYLTAFGDPMTLFRFMDGYQEGFFTWAGEELRTGAFRHGVDVMEMKAEYDAFLEGKDHKKYVKKASREVVEYGGAKMSKLQYISLYMTMQRQQAQRGLAENGFSLIDVNGQRVEVDGFLSRIQARIGSELGIKKSPDGTWKITEEQMKAAVESEIAEIKKQLTEEDLQFVGIIERTLNGKCKELKQARDMERLGYSNTISGYYYPIVRAMIAKTIDSQGMWGELDRASNISANKDTVKGAAGALWIESADTVFNRHIDAVARYAELSPAIDAINKLFNLDISGNKNKPKSVRTATFNSWQTAKLFGGAPSDVQRHNGEAYLKELLADLQGIGKRAGIGESFAEGLRGGFAISALAANPKVLLTQISSVFASTNVLSMKSVAAGARLGFGKGVGADVDKYCPVAKLRNYDSSAAKAQGVIENVRGVGEKLMTLVSVMDRGVVRTLWGACQVEIESTKGYKVGTEENAVEAGKLLERVIQETQQNSIATEKSAAMRSKSMLMKSLTMFTSDAMKSVGRVIDALGHRAALTARIKAAEASGDAKQANALKAELKGVDKQGRKSISALVTTAIYMTLIARAFSWLYAKDEEDENSVLAFIADVFGGMLGGLPIISDIYEFFVSGYDLSDNVYDTLNGVLEGVSKVVNTAGKMINGEATAADMNGATIYFAQTVGTVLGLPIRNVRNMVMGLTRRFNPNAAYRMEMLTKSKNYASDFEEALNAGDDDKAFMILELLLSERLAGEGEQVSFENSAYIDEVLRMEKAGYNILPRTIGDSVTIDGTDIDMSPEEQTALRARYSEALGVIERLVESKAYTSLSDEQKESAVRFVYDSYYDQGIYELYGYERNMKRRVFSKVISAEKLALANAVTAGLESDYEDKRGKVVASDKWGTIKGTTAKVNYSAVSGSKRKKVIAAINKLPLTTAEKLLIIAYKGYTIKDGDVRGVSAERAKKMLSQYAKKTGLTADEAKALEGYL